MRGFCFFHKPESIQKVKNDLGQLGIGHLFKVIHFSFLRCVEHLFCFYCSIVAVQKLHI